MPDIDVKLPDAVITDLHAKIIDVLPLLYPEITIEASMPPGNCTKVAYTVRLHPAVLRTTRSGAVSSVIVAVKCRDHTSNAEWVHLHPISSAGGQATGTFEWSIPANAGPWDPDWTNQATVEANPNELYGQANPFKVTERSASNNSITVSGTCIG